jgi:hypothetical protein
VTEAKNKKGLRRRLLKVGRYSRKFRMTAIDRQTDAAGQERQERERERKRGRVFKTKTR